MSRTSSNNPDLLRWCHTGRTVTTVLARPHPAAGSSHTGLNARPAVRSRSHPEEFQRPPRLGPTARVPSLFRLLIRHVELHISVVQKACCFSTPTKSALRHFCAKTCCFGGPQALKGARLLNSLCKGKSSQNASQLRRLESECSF